MLLPHVRLIQPEAMIEQVNDVTRSGVVRQLVFVLLCIWISGVVIFSVMMAWSLLSTTFLVRRATEFVHTGPTDSAESYATDNGRIHTEALSDETQTLMREMSVRLLSSEDCVTPFCWQLHSPVIVLPVALETFPAEELDAVLRHELAHLQARHPLRLFLQRLVETGFWFHPFVWMASREAALQRELASDRLANHTASQAAVFLRGMMRLASQCTIRTNGLVAGLGFSGSGQSMIQRRVEHLLAMDWSATRHPLRSLRSSSLITLTAIIASLFWIPLNADATGRTLLSPWPHISASLLHEMGIHVRDYELDSHRLKEHPHEHATPEEMH
jgi:beta-lactamase regulating signal transducer with metallopeptidase domain